MCLIKLELIQSGIIVLDEQKLSRRLSASKDEYYKFKENLMFIT